nr:DUF3592 domain-containing protein [Streptomyces sp. SID5785]
MVLTAGLVVLGFGVREVVIQRRLHHEGLRVRGQVVGHRRETSGRANSGPVFYAVVEFADAHGARHTVPAKSSGVKGLPVGGAVPVRYLRDAPETARLDLPGRRFTEIASVLGTGTLFTAIGIWMLATGR